MILKSYRSVHVHTLHFLMGLFHQSIYGSFANLCDGLWLIVFNWLLWLAYLCNGVWIVFYLPVMSIKIAVIKIIHASISGVKKTLIHIPSHMDIRLIGVSFFTCWRNRGDKGIANLLLVCYNSNYPSFQLVLRFMEFPYCIYLNLVVLFASSCLK